MANDRRPSSPPLQPACRLEAESRSREANLRLDMGTSPGGCHLGFFPDAPPGGGGSVPRLEVSTSVFSSSTAPGRPPRSNRTADQAIQLPPGPVEERPWLWAIYTPNLLEVGEAALLAIRLASAVLDEDSNTSSSRFRHCVKNNHSSTASWFRLTLRIRLSPRNVPCLSPCVPESANCLNGSPVLGTTVQEKMEPGCLWQGRSLTTHGNQAHVATSPRDLLGNDPWRLSLFHLERAGGHAANDAGGQTF